MTRVPSTSKEDAEQEVQQIYSKLEKMLGRVPNIFKHMGASPAVLKGYFSIKDVLNETTINIKLREKIALIVGAKNSCDYCIAAHAKGAKHLGIDDESIQKALIAESSDPKEDAILKFCAIVVEKRGFVSDEEVESLKNAGVADKEIVEIIFTIMMNMFTNYFNHIVETELDY